MPLTELQKKIIVITEVGNQFTGEAGLQSQLSRPWLTAPINNGQSCS